MTDHEVSHSNRKANADAKGDAAKVWLALSSLDVVGGDQDWGDGRAVSNAIWIIGTDKGFEGIA